MPIRRSPGGRSAPDSGRRAFLQTAFPLVGSGLTLLAILVAGRMIEPFTLGRRAAPSSEPPARAAGPDAEAAADRPADDDAGTAPDA